MEKLKDFKITRSHDKEETDFYFDENGGPAGDISRHAADDFRLKLEDEPAAITSSAGVDLLISEAAWKRIKAAIEPTRFQSVEIGFYILEDLVKRLTIDDLEIQ